MEFPVSLRFAEAARTLALAAAHRGLGCPGFRTPPRTPGVDRAIRRTAQGAFVSVRIQDRVFVEVLSDMVDGVVAANGLGGAEATRARLDLLAALEAAYEPAA